MITTPLIDLLERLESGKRPKGGVKNISEGVPSIGGEHLDNDGGFRFEKVKYVPTEFAFTMKKGLLEVGDILIVKDGATTGKVSYVGETFPYEKAVVNEHVFLCRTKPDVSSKYVFYYLWSEQGRRNILEDFRGAAQGGISTNFSKLVKVPIISKEEQDMVVAKIEELFSELDYSDNILRDSQTSASFYRRLKKSKIVVDNSLPKLPLAEIAERIQIGPFGSQLHKHDYIENGIPLINPANISNGKILPNYKKSITVEKYNELPMYHLAEGDVVLGRRGEMGRSALVTESEAGWFCGTGSIFIRLDKNKVNPAYLTELLSSEYAVTHLESKAGGTTMNNLNKKILSNFPVPLPSLERQVEIMQEVEELKSQISSINAIISSSVNNSKLFRQAILSKTFKGELL